MTEVPERNEQDPIAGNGSANGSGNGTMKRFNAQQLLKQSREIEIDHEGKIYRLRLTQANKLILTA